MTAAPVITGTYTENNRSDRQYSLGDSISGNLTLKYYYLQCVQHKNTSLPVSPTVDMLSGIHTRHYKNKLIMNTLMGDHSTFCYQCNKIEHKFGETHQVMLQLRTSRLKNIPITGKFFSLNTFTVYIQLHKCLLNPQ